jgi:hypothetical protein
VEGLRQEVILAKAIVSRNWHTWIEVGQDNRERQAQNSTGTSTAQGPENEIENDM